MKTVEELQIEADLAWNDYHSATNQLNPLMDRWREKLRELDKAKLRAEIEAENKPK